MSVIVAVIFVGTAILWIESSIDQMCDQIKRLIEKEHRHTNNEIDFHAREIKSAIEEKRENK